MSSNTPKSKPLLQSLDDLTRDYHLASLFNQDENNLCALSLWLLELKKGGTREYRLLYGWIISRISKELNTWSISNSLAESKASPYTYRVYRLTYHHSGQTIVNLVRQLCEGFSLQESCQRIGASEPLNSSNQQHPCGQFRLVTGSSDLAQLFAVRPVIFVEPTWTHLATVDKLKPVASPNEVVPAFMGSLCRLDKLNLFQLVTDTSSLQSEDLAKRCLSHLQEETGLNFCGVDSKRLGNLEWLCFPAADCYEKPQVKVCVDSFSNTATIEVPPNVIKGCAQATIRCRLWNDREVSLDCLKTLQNLETGASISFTTQQEITKYLVTIWVKSVSNDVEEIWYETSAPVLKQFNCSQGIVGFQGKLESKWLEEASKSRKLSNQVEQAQVVTQTHYEHLTVSNYQPEPWVVDGQKIYQFANHIFSASSGGLFIRDGWGADVEEPGIFTFFKWLQSLTDDASIGRVLIIDPYFDESGIIEVIARAGAAQAEYVVLANTQVNSRYPEDPNLPREPQRATRLKQTCHRGDISLLLAKLKFWLLDLRSITEKSDQLFHDRYILLFDSQGKTKTGYHLSNSIQGATKEHPLLITPIPSDVLPAVEAYVEKELLNPAPDCNQQVIQLFSSVRDSETVSTDINSPKLFDIENIYFFFAALLQDDSFLSLNQVTLQNHLKNYGVVDEEEKTFDFNEEDSTQIELYLNQFTQALVSSQPSDFVRLWTSLSSWLNHTSHNADYLNRIIATAGESLAVRLKDFLVKVPNELYLPIQSLKPSTHLEALSLVDLLKSDFSEVIHKCSTLLKFTDYQTWFPCLQDSGVRYASGALAQLYPEKLVNAISELQQILDTTSEDESNASRLWNVRHTIAFILKQILADLLASRFGHRQNDGFLTALLRSNIALIRAVTAYSFSPTWQVGIDVSKAFEAISILMPLEQNYTLAEWVFELRVRANQSGRLKDEDSKQIRLAIFNQMRKLFSEDIKDRDLIGILRRLSGPSEGDWSVSITNDLLIPCINESRLSVEQVTEFWLSLLFEKFKAHVVPPKTTQKDRVIDPTLQGLEGLELVQVGAWAIAHSTVERRKFWLDQLATLWQKSKGILAQPFLRYRRHQTWSSASTCLLWLTVLVDSFLQDCETFENIGDQPETDVLKQLKEQFSEILSATHEENPLLDRKWLWELVWNCENLKKVQKG